MKMKNASREISTHIVEINGSYVDLAAEPPKDKENNNGETKVRPEEETSGKNK